MNTTIANKLKRLRKQHGYSQEQVADHLHITQSTYGRMENGETNSWVSYIESICKLYNIEPKDLLQPDNVVINNIKDTKGAIFNNGYPAKLTVNAKIFNNGTINFLSEKLVELYENRLKEKDALIDELKNRIKQDTNL
ncbi:helix-turn-helix transcriptional regulator [Polaribacter sp.]|uniref:helix-turn-helix transcriptional regulator n=1 Tax=Polaribacter sp. TaxID=1920175 RepID=UPI004048382C